jgi:hypothetical protein
LTPELKKEEEENSGILSIRSLLPSANASEEHNYFPAKIASKHPQKETKNPTYVLVINH